MNIIQAKLPPFLKYKTTEDLVRLGKDNDGGYLVAQADIMESDFLLSFGIKEDWSFEKDFLELNSVPVLAYDGSISLKKFRKLFYKSFLNPLRIRRHFRRARIYSGFKSFFSGKNVHREKFIGLGDENFESLDELFSQIRSEKIFLKIDIEGHEYRILNELLKHQSRISGLAIEFHDCDLHIERLEKFITAFELSLIHIHPNNWVGIDSKGLPLAMEMTFSRNGVCHVAPSFPNNLDMANNSQKSDIRIDF